MNVLPSTHALGARRKNQSLYSLVPGHNVAFFLLRRPGRQPQALTGASPGSGFKAGIFLRGPRHPGLELARATPLGLCGTRPVQPVLGVGLTPDVLHPRTLLLPRQGHLGGLRFLHLRFEGLHENGGGRKELGPRMLEMVPKSEAQMTDLVERRLREMTFRRTSR